MEATSKAVLIVLALFAGVLLFTPYEAFLEGAIAFLVVAAAVLGFVMHPRREVFYVRTAVRLVDPDRKQIVERDLLAVRVELARLWLLFVPTALAVAFLVFFAAGGPAKFSFLNWFFSSQYAYLALFICEYAPLLVIFLLWAWIGERWVMKDAEACSVRSFSISREPFRWARRVAYVFMGEHGEYYGGYCPYFGLAHSRELATIVFHNVRKPEVNKIAMGFLFHRVITLGRGVTDLDAETTAARTVLAETRSPSWSRPIP